MLLGILLGRRFVIMALEKSSDAGQQWALEPGRLRRWLRRWSRLHCGLSWFLPELRLGLGLRLQLRRPEDRQRRKQVDAEQLLMCARDHAEEQHAEDKSF